MDMLPLKPLTLTELRFALAVCADTTYTSIRQCQRSELYVETDEEMEKRVQDLSKGLVETLVPKTGGEPIVQFVHQSVIDFLYEDELQVLDESSSGTVEGRGNFWISRSCIRYLSMEEIQGYALSPWDPGHNEPDVENNDYLALLSYSVHFWIEHVQYVEKDGMPQDDLVALSSKLTDGALHSWFDIYQKLLSRLDDDDEPSDDSSLLHFASVHNLLSVVNGFLSQNVCADLVNENSETPLSFAAKKGHIAIVELFLSRDDVNADHKVKFGNTPLALAARNGHESVVKLLLSRNDVDVHSENSWNFTPLSEAARSGHEAVVKLLINRDKFDVNHKTRKGDTPLSLAAANGNEAVVKMLMTRDDVIIKSQNAAGDTPLSKAAHYGDKGIVALLLDPGLGQSPNSEQLATALLRAAEHGHYDIVKLLLENNADIDTRDEEKRTPLSLASCEDENEYDPDRYKLVDLLLQRSSCADSKDTWGRTPLSYAAGCRDLNIFRLFMERGDVDFNSRDRSGRTPLSYAASDWSVEIVEMLVNRSDVDVDAED